MHSDFRIQVSFMAFLTILKTASMNEIGEKGCPGSLAEYEKKIKLQNHVDAIKGFNYITEEPITYSAAEYEKSKTLPEAKKGRRSTDSFMDGLHGSYERRG